MKSSDLFKHHIADCTTTSALAKNVKTTQESSHARVKVAQNANKAITKTITDLDIESAGRQMVKTNKALSELSQTIQLKVLWFSQQARGIYALKWVENRFLSFVHILRIAMIPLFVLVFIVILIRLWPDSMALTSSH